jgi:hypothetical protein
MGWGTVWATFLRFLFSDDLLMANWVAYSFLYNFDPTLPNFIKFRWSHFRFCRSDDPTITASLYLDNLASEIGMAALS